MLYSHAFSDSMNGFLKAQQPEANHYCFDPTRQVYFIIKCKIANRVRLLKNNNPASTFIRIHTFTIAKLSCVDTSQPVIVTFWTD